MNKNSVGFTLAEVLITLTIIGVIAAITIPNLMQKHRKHEIEVGVKAAYSIIQNAVKMSISENGPVDSWNYSGTATFAQNYILPYLKVQKICGFNSSSAPHGCFYNNSNYIYSNNGMWFYINGSAAQYESRNHYNVKLQNGMSLGILVTNNTNYSKIYKPVAFVFDVNGSAGPTKAGVDVFAFSMDTATGKFWTGAVEAAWLGDIKTAEQVLNNTKNTGGCNINSHNQSGMACARVLEQNSWSFPDNYPIKKF